MKHNRCLRMFGGAIGAFFLLVTSGAPAQTVPPEPALNHFAEPAYAQTPTEKIVIDEANIHLKKLKYLMPRAQSQAKKLSALVAQMLRQYDEIITMGPGAERREMVSLYQLERPSAFAHKANLDNDVREIAPDIMPAMDYLAKYSDYRYFPAWKELNNLAFDAQSAVDNSKRIVPPPPLPDPLPDRAVPSLEVIEVSYANNIVVGEPNEFKVTVRCNRKFTSAPGTIEARVRGGSATLHDPAQRAVTVGPQAPVTLTWRFTATAEGDVKIGARVLR